MVADNIIFLGERLSRTTDILSRLWERAGVGEIAISLLLDVSIEEVQEWQAMAHQPSKTNLSRLQVLDAIVNKLFQAAPFATSGDLNKLLWAKWETVKRAVIMLRPTDLDDYCDLIARAHMALEDAALEDVLRTLRGR